MGQHPGGADQIEEHLGKSIDDPFEEAEHTKSAKQIFKDLPVVGYMEGTIIPEKDKDDLTGVGGFQLTSKLKFDYTKGLFI